MGTRGVWSLENVEIKYPQDDWVSLPNVYLLDNDVGHLRDGVSDGPLTRTNLGLELTSYAPSITNITRWSAGSSCQTHALFAGGATSGSTSPPAVSSTYKLTYSSYTSARAPSADIPVPKAISIGVASEDNAYINSGYEGGGSPAGQTGTCKISFTTDTTTNLPSANINSINWEMQSLTDGAGGGYLFGGTWVPTQGNNGSRCYKITYSTDGLALLPGSYTVWNTLETNRNPECSRASMMNTTAGYQSGGDSFPGSDGSSMTTKLTYSSMSWSVVPGAYIPNPREKAASGTGNTKAWYGCGQNSGNHSNFTLLDFSAETWSAVPGMNHPGPSSSGNESANTSTSPRDSLKGADKSSGLGDGYNYDGYKKKRWYDDAAWNTYGGGAGVDFNGTSPDSYLTSNAAYVDMSDSFCVEAYVKWDTMGAPSHMGMICSQYEASQTGRMLFGSQSTNNLVVRWNGGGVKLETGSNTITTGTWYHTAWTWDGTTHRLFLDGKLKDTCTSSDMSVVYVGTETEIGGQSTLSGYTLNGKISNFRIVQGDAVYTEDFNIPTSGLLTNITGTGLLCCQSGVGVTVTAAGTVTAGGDAPGLTVFTDDTTLPINKSPLATPTSSTMAVANPSLSTTGYFYGGSYPIKSLCDKLTFSNDTCSATPGANYPGTLMAGGSAISSPTKGYQLGGFTTHEGGSTKTSRSLTYASDTWSGAIPSAEPQQSAGWCAGTNSDTAGYQGTGAQTYNPKYSYMNKLTFSNDTKSNLPNTPTANDLMLTAIGRSVSSYWFGGYGPGSKSWISKIIHSTDTQNILSATTTNNNGARSSQSSGNGEYGYFMGYASSGGNKSMVDKITYSTDTCSTSSNMPGTLYYGCAVSSVTAGYVTMTKGNPNGSDKVTKYTFATETSSAVPDLTTARYNGGQTGSASNANAYPISPVLI